MTRIRPTRFALGLAASVIVAPVALTLILAVYTAIAGGLQGRNDYVAQPYAYAKTADPNQIVLLVTVGLGDDVVAANVRKAAAQERR